MDTPKIRIPGCEMNAGLIQLTLQFGRTNTKLLAPVATVDGTYVNDIDFDSNKDIKSEYNNESWMYLNYIYELYQTFPEMDNEWTDEGGTDEISNDVSSISEQVHNV